MRRWRSPLRRQSASEQQHSRLVEAPSMSRHSSSSKADPPALDTTMLVPESDDSTVTAANSHVTYQDDCWTELRKAKDRLPEVRAALDQAYQAAHKPTPPSSRTSSRRAKKLESERRLRKLFADTSARRSSSPFKKSSIVATVRPSIIDCDNLTCSLQVTPAGKTLRTAALPEPPVQTRRVVAKSTTTVRHKSSTTTTPPTTTVEIQETPKEPKKNVSTTKTKSSNRSSTTPVTHASTVTPKKETTESSDTDTTASKHSSEEEDDIHSDGFVGLLLEFRNRDQSTIPAWITIPQGPAWQVEV